MNDKNSRPTSKTPSETPSDDVNFLRAKLKRELRNILCSPLLPPEFLGGLRAGLGIKSSKKPHA